MIFSVNPLLEKELLKDPEYDDMLKKTTEDVKRVAESIAPSGRTGNYGKSFVVYKDGDHWVLGNTDFAAHIVEWGSVYNPAYAPLRRAVQTVGLRLSEAPKP